MPPPELIEIQPLDHPVRAAITVPGSKSITNRALLLAALSSGATTLKGALWSEDTQVMVDGLRALGFTLEVKPDPAEFCDRTIVVQGLRGKIPRAGTTEKPLELFVGNAGTAARFLAALVCLGDGVFRLRGVPRMHERPQSALFRALRDLGYRVDSPNDKLPATLHGAGARPGKCRVSIEESSQFASALLLCERAGGWQVEVVGESSEESSYVEMTRKLIAAFPAADGSFQIEPDASSGAYFLAAGELIAPSRDSSPLARVVHWPESGWQIDQHFLDRIRGLRTQSASQNGSATFPSPRSVPGISRHCDLGDSIMMAIVMAPTFQIPGASVRFTDLGRLRLQECERVAALRTELTKCGADVKEEGDTLVVAAASKLHGAEIETYHDHRMAMCFAILGLKVPGIKIKNPNCVKKTFPNFFQKLAGTPPEGLGAVVFDARSGEALPVSDLYAE